MKSCVKICVVGACHSGSTRLFNLVRMIYEKKGKSVYSGWSVNIADFQNDYDIILSKIHDTENEYLNEFDIKLDYCITPEKIYHFEK